MLLMLPVIGLGCTNSSKNSDNSQENKSLPFIGENKQTVKEISLTSRQIDSDYLIVNNKE